MAVIPLYSAANASYSVSVGARTRDGTQSVEAITISARENGGTTFGPAEFRIAPPFDLPDEFVKDGRLKTWAEIQQDIKALRDAADAKAAAAKELARDRLREALANSSIDLTAAAGGFLAINGVGFAGAAATAHLSIDLVLLDPTLTPKPADDVAILSASLSANGKVQFAGNTCDAAMRLEVIVTRGGLINAIPSLSIDAPAGVKLPAFDFRWPKIDWRSLDWTALDVKHLATLFRFDLPIPKIGDLDQPLHVNWTTPPQIAFGIGAQNALTIATTQDGAGDLVCDTKNAAGAVVAEKVAGITGFNIALAAGASLTVAGKVTPADMTIPLPKKIVDQPDALPFTIEIDPGTLKIRIAIEFVLPHTAGADITATLDLPRVLIRAKSDPALLLALHATYQQTYDTATGELHGKLTALEIVEPYPIALISLAAREAADAAQGLIRLIGAIRLPKPTVPETGLLAVLERIAAMAGAAVTWLVRQAGGAVDALLGVAEAVGKGLEQMVRWLRDALGGLTAGDPHLAIEVRLDSRTFALRQIVISPAWSAEPNAPFTGEALGLEVTVPLNWRPSLVIDLDGPASVALIALQGQTAAPFKLGTDLWLSRDAGIESVRDTDAGGERTKERLIEVSAKLTVKQPLVIFRFRAGKATFFEKMVANVTPVIGNAVSIATVSGAVEYHPITWAEVTIDGQIAPGTAERLLPFLQSSKGNAEPGFLKNLNQYISVKPGTPRAGHNNGEVVLPLDAELHVRSTSVKFPLEIKLNLKTFDVRFSGPETIVIKGKANDNGFDIFGLTGKIVEKTPSKPPAAEYGFYKLDFSKGDVRLSLADGARLDLAYGKVASGGRGIVFRVDELGLSRSGLDLSAKVDPDTPVQLAGVDMPFRFDSGGLSIKNSEIQAFSIKGSGQLPPELVGEANATISISMGRGSDGSLIVQSAEATLDKSSDPIVCHGTRFTLTLSAIGFQFQDFSSEGSGYHFYFTLTGTAEFKPRAGEFTDGLLKNFGSLTITLDKAPLARDPSMLLRAIEFQVAVEPKKQINFFNLFTFELRGIGFHPASPAFDGKPAMSVSGQVNFVEAGDIVSPRFDFHKLWIAPPPDGDWRPHVRFDGLTVGVRFGGAASIEATAIAVDDKLPTLFKPGALPADVTAHGFLASGKLTIKGWGQMAASMGFLELQKKPNGELRQAFFLYGQAGELSIEIPTPLGPIYLREVGFGFGFRYTLAAFNRADQVHNVKELIQVLDDISKYQGELATVTAWEPEAEGNRLTLALRGLISISTASGETDYNADGEKELPNPVLFDIVAALRSDLTFFMNARVWIARNYADWHDSSATADAWRTNPTLRGYVYLSVPRKEFLGRMIADGTGDVEGKHPELPAPLVQAMKAIRWSATTYIRPGLFHQEFGWPYELGFTFERGSNFRIVCQGGLVNRIEDLSILYGIAFRAKGFAQIGGSIGGRSFGASVVARADFSIDAKFIAYLSIKRFSDTLFYGSLAFDVSISLQVRVWLEFSVGFTDIHLEVGFSLSLTISIALEVAVSPNSLGGRASASVGVGAFGRSIRLGIGFGFNEGALNTARSRVERFLSLGLTVATPDAEQGVAPPAPEQPRGPASRDADQAVDHALDKHDDVSIVPAPGAPAPIPQGRALQPSGYWAMLFPVAGDAAKGDQERFVMIFVPRDHSETGLEEKRLPKHGADGEPLGTFYAPPAVFETIGAAPVPASLSIRKGALGAAIPVRKLELRKDAGGTIVRDVLFGDVAPIDIVYDVARAAAKSGKESLSLGRFLGQCFVRVGDAIADLREPVAKEVKAEPERLPQAREAAAQVLTEAGRDQIALKPEERAANDIEERRSSMIASLCESAAKLAAGGDTAWGTEAAEPGLDVRALGVAFVITKAQVKELFEYGGDRDDPHPAKFELVAANSSIQPVAQPVHLFNAPERMFRERGPKLAEPVVEATRTGVRLDWDLEPAFGPSTGVWNDPEFDLKHYRIERIVMSSQTAAAPFPPRRVTVKAAAPMRLVRDPVSGTFVWRFLRPNAQFVDDLSDLPPDVRAAILPGAILSGAASATDIDSVRYVVVPVDSAGTDGAPTPLQLTVRRPGQSRAGVRRAVLHFEYKGANGQIRDIDARPARPAVTLGLDDGKDPASSQQSDERPNIEGDRIYFLRVRKERGVPTGLYGADAVTDALARPSAGDFAVRQVADVDFELTLPKTKSDGPKTPNKIPAFDAPLVLTEGDGYRLKAIGPKADADDLASFFKAIGVDLPGDKRAAAGALGVRFAIRPKPDSDPKARETSAPWCPVDITMMIDPPRDADARASDKSPPVAAPVEIFEHPIAIDAAPLLFDDLGGEAGRVLVWHPNKTGLLGALLAPVANDPGLVLLRDGARRVATRVRWNGRPAVDDVNAGKSSAKRLARFFGGFDLFEVDAAGEVEGASTAPAAITIAYKFSASTIDADPGNGTLRLNKADQSFATELYVDPRDKSGADRSFALDLLDQSSERLKGQLRLVKATDPSRWIAFDLTAAVRAQGYRKLMLVATDASERKPFANNDPVVVLFTRLPARHAARVQALPAALAKLDPAEIADFAKVEAHYPSETRRLQEKRAGRRAAWYSPAESYVVWPQQSLRRSLSINVDELILTELLSNGRPTHIEASLKIGQSVYAVSRRGGAASPFLLANGRGAAGSLRALLQDLTWNDKDNKVKEHYAAKPAEFRSARVTVTARKIPNGGGPPGIMLASAEFQVDLDPALHPALADAIDWARYHAMPGSAFPRLRIDQSALDAALGANQLAQCTAVTFALEGWPAARPQPVLVLRAGGETSPSLRLEFPPGVQTAKQRFDRLKAATAHLTTSLAAKAREDLARDFNKTPADYANVRLRLHCEMAPAGTPPLDVRLTIDIGSIAADLDQSVYRRYEPVLEPLPKTGATDVAAWFDESPAERDPYGWGILRTFGLGMGLRLYDTETRDYAAPRDTLRLLKDALTRALEWYADLALGAPFVDVVTRAGGTMKLASFDGGTPGTSERDVNGLLDHDALALTQISLRPVVDRWRRYASDPAGIEKPVAYFAIRKTDKAATELKIDLALVQQNDVVAIADVLDLTTRLAKPPSATLSAPILEVDPKKKEAKEKLRDALTGHAGVASTLTLDVSHAAVNELVALVRGSVAEKDAFAVFGMAWGRGAAAGSVEEIADPIAMAGAEPFGRFGEMAGERYGALARSHPGIIGANATMQRYARRRWPDGWPAGEAEAALIARLPDWTRRFVDHAPGLRPPRDVHFSLAEVTRPDPWRVGVQDDGTMEVLFTHNDRKRRLKRYAVRPFGRYESFVEALHTADADNSPRVPQLSGAWSDGLAGFEDAQKRFEESWSRRLFDVVIPRTEPVAAPVLVDAKRIEILRPGEAPRRVLEFIYKRHTEEILSEANVTVEGALSFETVSVGFWREFGMQRWAHDLRPGINTAAAFGDWEKRPAPAALIAGGDNFGGLAENPGRYTDGWQGALALRTEALPFFFRIHAAAFASAGVVVSEPVVATVEEGHYELHLPWQQPLFDQKTPGPRWSVLRTPAQPGSEGGIFVVFQLPLVRFVDEMPPDTRPIWLSASAVPEVFTLPDPLARYEIRAVAADSAGLSSASSELDVIGEQRPEPSVTVPSPPKSGYRTNIVGPLFKSGTAAADAPFRCDNHGVWWQLGVSARLLQHDALPAVSFAPGIDLVNGVSPLTLCELHQDAFAAGAFWTTLAPRTDVTVNVTAVANTNAPAFAQFKVDVRVWRDAFAPYAADLAAKTILDFLQLWVDTDGNAPPPTSLAVAGFTWGLPRIAAGRPPAVAIVHTAIGDWQVPADAGIAQREKLRTLTTVKTAAGYDQTMFAAGLCAALRREMRRLAAARKEAEDDNRFIDFPPFASPLRPDIAAAALAVGLAQPGGARLLPRYADVIAAVRIEVDPQAAAAAIVALIAAVEAAEFTAAAIADLGALEDGGASALVHLPCDALVNATVTAALAAVAANDPAAWRAVSLLLRMPPLDDERDTILAAIDTTVTDAAVRAVLRAFADDAMTGQIFGAGRTPGLKVFRGTANPAADAIVRAQGGAKRCQ